MTYTYCTLLSINPSTLPHLIGLYPIQILSFFPPYLILILPLILSTTSLSSLHGSLQRLRQYQASEAKQARTQQLKETEFFKQADENPGAVLMFVMNESTMWMVCNDAFTARMEAATELWDIALQRKLTWAYLMAPIYAHQDRRLYIDNVTELTFGHRPMKLTMLTKIYTNDGTTKLYLNTVRSMRLGPQTTGLIFKTERE